MVKGMLCFKHIVLMKPNTIYDENPPIKKMTNYFWISSEKCKNKENNKIAITGSNCQINLFESYMKLKIHEINM